jgi:hypothetical protein
VDREGNVYVVTVAANKPRTSEGTLLVFDPQGKRLRSVSIKGSSRLLLDVGFHPQTGKLLMVDYGAAKVLSVDHRAGASSVFMTVTGKHSGLDRITFDAAGNVYVTDAHQGIIWKVGRSPGHHLKSRTRRWRSVGMGQQPTAQADADTANHRRERSVEQGQS